MQVQTLALDIVPGGVPPVVDVTQYDTGREIKIALSNRTNPQFVLSASYTYEIRGTRPDGTGFVEDNIVSLIDARTLSFMTTGAMTVIAGSATCGLLIFDGDEHIETLHFILQIQPASLPAEIIVDDRDFGSIIENAVREYLDGHGIDIDTGYTTTVTPINEITTLTQFGKVCTLTFAGVFGIEVDEQLQMEEVLPVGSRPASQVHALLFTYTGKRFYVGVSTTGVITIIPAVTIPEDEGIYDSLVFVAS